MIKYKVSYKCQDGSNIEHTFINEKIAYRFINMCFSFGYKKVTIEQIIITENE